MVKKFQRTKENFICEKCGFVMKGNGYTNHCSNCLWSKHVDLNPGDRQSNCNGLMEPIGIEIKRGQYIILHHCIKCGVKKRNKASRDDNISIFLKK
ncbi:MAG: RNHCP domain-containing protein [Minisyncoccia bacterium]